MKSKRKRIVITPKPQLVFSTTKKIKFIVSTENKGDKIIVNN